MKPISHTNNLSTAVICILAILLLISCQKTIEPVPAPDEVAGSSKSDKKDLKDYVQVNLVGDNNEYHPMRIDPNLVNGWGISFAPSGPAWVSSEGRGVSVIYNTLGNDVRPPVAIPSPGATTGGHPTGQVFNGTSDFKLPNGNPARFIFAGADGVISGWNGGNAAIKMVDDSPNAVYLGIALASNGGANFLYVANFSEGKIDVYDKNWADVSMPFRDHHLPRGYSPFNIQNIGGKLYVMYAKVDPVTHDEQVGPGNGVVDIFNTDGTLMKRFVTRRQLNAPWGAALAPDGFFKGEEEGDDDDKHGDLHNVVLIGNFGDGRINAFNSKGDFVGQLRTHGKPIKIEGLWGISFAPATAITIDPNWLFFAAGPDNEEHGLFGYIRNK